MATKTTTKKVDGNKKTKTNLDDIKGDMFELNGVIRIADNQAQKDKLVAFGYKKVEDTTAPDPEQPETPPQE